MTKILSKYKDEIEEKNNIIANTGKTKDDKYAL